MNISAFCLLEASQNKTALFNQEKMFNLVVICELINNFLIPCRLAPEEKSGL